MSVSINYYDTVTSLSLTSWLFIRRMADFPPLKKPLQNKNRKKLCKW